MKFIHILKSRLHFNAVRFSFKINRLMKDLLFFVQILYKSKDSIRLVVFDMFRCLWPFIVKNNGEFRI